MLIQFVIKTPLVCSPSIHGHWPMAMLNKCTVRYSHHNAVYFEILYLYSDFNDSFRICNPYTKIDLFTTVRGAVSLCQGYLAIPGLCKINFKITIFIQYSTVGGGAMDHGGSRKLWTRHQGHAVDYDD